MDPQTEPPPQEPPAMYHQFEMPPPPPPVNVVGPQFMYPHPVDLLIVRKLMTLSEGSFTVTDPNGNLMFRIKDKVISLHDRHTLLDKFDNPLLTFQKKRLSAHRKWYAFAGESSDPKDLLFTVMKSSVIQLIHTELDVFLSTNVKQEVCDFKIKGSFSEKHCTIFAGNCEIKIAQMYVQHTVQSVIFGKDTLGVTVYPNIDYAFIIALVVILDEINDDRGDDN